MPSGRGFEQADGDHTQPDLPAVRAAVPQLLPQVELLGEYRGSGLTDVTFLVRQPGGQVVQVSRLLYFVLSEIDGYRTVPDVAARVSAPYGRTVSADNIEYLLNRKLAPLGLLARADGRPGPANPGWDQGILTLKLRCTLIPEVGVQFFARLFRPLFSPLAVVVMLGGLIASDTWLLRGGRLGPAFAYVLGHPVLLLIVIGLTLLSTLFHECGHAAACHYGGARPGVIGMGVYVIWPAFFTNVTDAYRLGRAGRVRTDLGGVYFNAIFAVGLTAVYLETGYRPLIAAVVLVHMEIVQQLLPSLRFDGYFILADLIGVPDLFRRIGPVLRSVIPGQPADPRVQGLKRGARVILTAWVLLMAPLIGLELALTILNGPTLVRLFAESLNYQVRELVGQLGRADIAGGLLSVFSVIMLVLPMAGLCYVLLLTGWRFLRGFVAVNRRRPVLWLPSAAMVLLVAAVLAVHWHLLPPVGGAAPSPSAAGDVTVQRPPAAAPAPVVGAAAASASSQSRATTPARPAAPARPETPARRARPAVLITPVGAHGFDPLDTQGDPNDENDGEARYAIDGDPATAWQSQYYLGSPVFGRLKAGSGLILDMGRPVRVRSVTVTFGAEPGADVAIKVGNDDALAASSLPSFTTVAAAGGIGGTHTFRITRPPRRRYLLIWFTKLPPIGPGRYRAQISNVVVRGFR